MWLDATCMEWCGQSYLQCAVGQRIEMLDLIAFRKNAEKDPGLSPGMEFFSTLRKYTADGFFTSEIGNQVPRLHRRHLPEGVLRLPRGTGSLERISVHSTTELRSFVTAFGWNRSRISGDGQTSVIQDRSADDPRADFISSLKLLLYTR